MKAATASIIRKLDRSAIEEYGIPGAVLMENAGRGSARILLDRFGEAYQTGVTIVAGTATTAVTGLLSPATSLTRASRQTSSSPAR